MGKQRHGPVELKIFNASFSDVMGDIARVDLSHRPFAKAGRVIVIKHGEKRALVVARGPAGVGTTGISLESATRDKLGVKLGQTASFEFEEAGFWEEAKWAWHATDAMPRVGARLGVIGLALGVFGLFLGIISLFVTFMPPRCDLAVGAAQPQPALQTKVPPTTDSQNIAGPAASRSHPERRP